LNKLSELYKRKKFDVIVFSLVTVMIAIVFMVSDTIIQKKIKLILDQKYTIYSSKLNHDIKSLIDSKKEMTLTIALSLAQETNLKKALLDNDSSNINLKTFSKKLSEQTSFKNVWFHIVDKNGNSFYRSWIDKRGDSILNIRLDVKKMIQKPKVMSTISVGKFDMTFKSMVPIYEGDQFIGIFEIITHFNSIAKNLSKNNIGAIVLVDKKYKGQLKKAFTKTFLDDYYIANLDANKDLLSYVKKNGIENFFNNKTNYLLDEKFGKLITFYNIPDISGEPMATIIAFKNISTINTDDIKALKTNIVFYTVLVVLVLAIFGYFLVVKEYSKKLNKKVMKRTKQLNNEKSYIQTILDTNSSMILVMKEKELIQANKTFLDFFGYKTLKEFKDENISIGYFFILLNDLPFPKDRMINDKFWTIYLSENKKKDNIVKLQFKNDIYYFTINVLNMNINNEILINMQNITELKEKEQLLYEQSKMASLGEMIGNISHQWRQPLSVISTAATGMMFKKEFSILSDEDFKNNCTSINTNAQYLSKTIDDFKNFIQGDSKQIEFNIKDEINEFVNIVDSTIKKHQIQVIINSMDDTIIMGYPSELIQCFINIFNNAKDALVENNEVENRYVFINQEIKENKVIIEFKDNAKGINNEIINNIFEPYFTTKHKSQGTGLGLHMTYNLIVNAMKGTITVKNVEYRYEEKIFKGACFRICIPLN
jgi:signal transduction histidine kinase